MQGLTTGGQEGKATSHAFCTVTTRTCATTACKPRDAKSPQEKTPAVFDYPIKKRPWYCQTRAGGGWQARVTYMTLRQMPGLHQALTHSLLGCCSEASERPQRCTCYFWAAPQWPALPLPNLPSWHLKNGALLVISCENLSNPQSPALFCRILSLLAWITSLRVDRRSRWPFKVPCNSDHSVIPWQISPIRQVFCLDRGLPPSEQKCTGLTETSHRNVLPPPAWPRTAPVLCPQ